MSPMPRRLRSAWRALTGSPHTRSDYAAAEMHRLLADWVATGATADDIARWSNQRLRNRARDLERNNPTIRNYLRLLGNSVIGPDGVRLQAQVRNNDGRLARPINDRIEAAWYDWCSYVSLNCAMSMTDFSRLCVKSVARDGEAFVRLWLAYPDNPYRLALEMIDPDLVDDQMNVLAGEGRNAVRMGVEVNEYGRPVAYHVWSAPLGFGSSQPRTRERIPAEQVIHLYDVERSNQTRGVTWLASTMVAAKHLEGYAESELVAARIGAAKMGFFQRKEGAIGPSALQGDGNEAPSLTMESNPGSFGVLPDGYELATFSPDHPSSGYGAFVKDTMRRIATGLGVSYNALASDLEGVNYSSMRSGLLIERDGFRCVQQWWIGALLRPVYAAWMRMALGSGALVLDSREVKRFLAAKWSPRGWAWVDPAKDTQAGVLGVQSGLASRQELLAEQGKDVEAVFEQLAVEQELAAEYGISIMPVGAPASGGPPEEPPDPEEPEDEPADDSADRNGHGVAVPIRWPGRY